MKITITEVNVNGSRGYIARGICNCVEIYSSGKTAEEALRRYERLAHGAPERKPFIETIAAVLTDS